MKYLWSRIALDWDFVGILIILSVTVGQIFFPYMAEGANCASANVLCVDDTSGATQEYTTIQSAAEDTSPGDTVQIHDGHYAGFRVSINGTSSLPIVFIAQGTNVFIDQDGPTGDGIRLQNVNYITIDGFKISGSSQRCIAARGATATSPMFNLIIKNNTCTNSGRDGFYLSQANSALIENNVITNVVLGGNTLEHGFYLANAGSDNTIIRGNTISPLGGMAGIHINGDISIGGDGIISGLVIEKNTIHRSSQNGISMDGVQNSTIQNNVIYGNARHAIRAFWIDGAQGPKDLKIINNTLLARSGGGWPIKISGDLGGHVIFNNILLNDNPSLGSISVGNSNFSSSNNIGTGVFSVNNESSTISLSQWQALGYGANSFIGTQSNLFMNPSGGDYSLKNSALAINSAVHTFNGVEAPSSDRLGVLRLQGMVLDVGAYESTGDTTPPSPPTGLRVIP